MPKLQVLSPVGEVKAARQPLAPRLAGLGGKRVGALDNVKPNASVFLQRVQELLVERYGATRGVLRRKATVSAGADPEVIADLARQSDAVVTAFGD